MTGTTPETVDICICTYRRDHLAETLKTVLAQDLPENLTARIIVADNDTEPSARSLVETAGAGASIPITYVHAPERNISIARNACLDAATADWVSFIDDDEIAPADWIATLWQAARDGGFDVMFGPAISIYPEDTPGWIEAEDYHTNRVPVHAGTVSTGHTCNVLLRWNGTPIAAERFRLENGRTGGEDVEYFFRLSRLGFVLGNCDAAAVSERTTSGRLTYRWLRQRKFAAGQFHGAYTYEHGGTLSQRAGLLARSGVKAVASFAAALVFLWDRRRRNSWAIRGWLHAGVCASALGFGLAELY